MKIIFALVAVIALVGCGNNAAVEFGMNDEAVLDSEFGDIGMKIRGTPFGKVLNTYK